MKDTFTITYDKKISTYLCLKDERESLKKLNMSRDIHKSLFTTQ